METKQTNTPEKTFSLDSGLEVLTDNEIQDVSGAWDWKWVAAAVIAPVPTGIVYWGYRSNRQKRPC